MEVKISTVIYKVWSRCVVHIVLHAVNLSIPPHSQVLDSEYHALLALQYLNDLLGSTPPCDVNLTSTVYILSYVVNRLEDQTVERQFSEVCKLSTHILYTPSHSSAHTHTLTLGTAPTHMHTHLLTHKHAYTSSWYCWLAVKFWTFPYCKPLAILTLVLQIMYVTIY